MKPPTGRRDRRSRPTVRGLIAGAIVVLGAVVAAWWLWPGDGAAVSSKPPYRDRSIKEVTPAAVETKPVEAVQEEKPAAPVEKYPGETIYNVTTNADGTMLERTVDKNGRKTIHVVTPPPIFKNPTDELLYVALTTPQGQQMPPFPDMSPTMDKEFLAALEKPIEILKTDSADVVAKKQLVESVRQELRDRVENGEHFCDILQEHRKIVNENIDLRAEVIKSYKRFLETDKEFVADAYLQSANAQLEKMGIDKVEVNPTQTGGRSNE